MPRSPLPNNSRASPTPREPRTAEHCKIHPPLPLPPPSTLQDGEQNRQHLQLGLFVLFSNHETLTSVAALRHCRGKSLSFTGSMNGLAHDARTPRSCERPSTSTRRHYEDVAAGGTYESAVFYATDSAYVQWVAERCFAHVQRPPRRDDDDVSLDDDDEDSGGVKGTTTTEPRDARGVEGGVGCGSRRLLRLVDIGGGTGTFTARLARMLAEGTALSAHGDADGVVTTANRDKHPLALCVDPCPVRMGKKSKKINRNCWTEQPSQKPFLQPGG